MSPLPAPEHAASANPKFSVCVYCGSRPGVDPAFAAAAVAMGTRIGELGLRLVYGGGRSGLMGVVADAALAAGAEVVGIIPHALMHRELGHPGLHELLVVDTMHERKRLMAERSDAFVAMPGGIGTLEELFEVWTWRQLSYHDKPIGLLNVAGFYDPMLAFMDSIAAHGFVTPAQRALLQVSADASGLLDTLTRLGARATLPDDYRRI
ncbi:MAG: Rossman fold protein family [Rhizobacter sp.]|nr:Rossman fold protein family [Rhizobacter sp.]